MLTGSSHGRMHASLCSGVLAHVSARACVLAHTRNCPHAHSPMRTYTGAIAHPLLTHDLRAARPLAHPPVLVRYAYTRAHIPPLSLSLSHTLAHSSTTPCTTLDIAKLKLYCLTGPPQFLTVDPPPSSFR